MFRRLDCRGDYIINARLSLLGVQLEQSNWWIPIFTWICVVYLLKIEMEYYTALDAGRMDMWNWLI